MKVYNKIAPVYDIMVDWEERLKHEESFFLHLFREQMTSSILDLGCGSGGHALHWADMGYNVIGIDSAKDMIKLAEQKAEEMEVDAEFQCLKMTDFAGKIQQEFDMVACLGNTLPHVLEPADLNRTMQEIAKSLKPTGIAVIHLLNYKRILELRLRDLPVKSKTVDGSEYLFLRFYNYQDPLLEFNYVVAQKESDAWTSRSFQMKLRPWVMEEIQESAMAAGFKTVMAYGGYDFCEYDEDKSDDLILVCDFVEE